MSNEIEEQIIEDVEAKDLVEDEATTEEVVEETATEEVEETKQEEVSEETEIAEEETEEVVEETTEEVSEEAEEVEEETQPLSDTVLDVLLGEAKKTKAEAEEEDSEAEEDDDDEELEEAKKVKEEEDESDEEEDEDESEVAEEVEEDEEESDEEEDESEDEELPEVTTKAGYLAASFGALKGMRKSELVSAYQAVNPVVEGEEVEETPKTKAEIINAMYGQLKAMKKDDLMASYKSIMASCGGKHESVDYEAEELFAEDLKVLANADQELTEDFKQKASILFEAAVANKVNTIKEELEAEYSSDLQEEVTYVRESLIEKIDDYLSFVVESWIEENQEFVDNKLRVEITENFMKALQNTFTEHYIEVPDSKVDLVDDLSEQVTEIKESLANVSAEKEELARQVEELSREKIISEASADLASTEAGKLASLVEETEFVDSETFAAKVATIKEGFFKESTKTEEVLTETVDSAETEVKTIVEGEISQEAKLPKDMAKYVTHLSRFK